MAELIGFQNGNNLLSLHQFGARIRVGARVTLADDGATIPVGDALLGRITDALGNPIDGEGPLRPDDSWPLMGREINPLARKPVNAPLDVGVRAINALLSVGKGQRIGIIAGSGVGKSVLLGMMSRFTTADIVVVGMIGERGREVGEFAKTVLDQDLKITHRHRRRSGGPLATASDSRRRAGDCHRRILPRQGQGCPSHHGLSDPRGTCTARNWSGAW